MNAKLRGAWNESEAESFLAAASYPLRLSCLGSDGFPRVVSLWYRYQSGYIYCVTHQSSKLSLMLSSDPRVGFEVSPNEPPYFGVRGQGQVKIQALGQSPMLGQLLDHYLGSVESDLASWLLSRSDEECLLRIEPIRLYSWDYRDRMANHA